MLRPRHQGSRSCNRLLAHLHAVGFTSVPKPVGVDDKWERVGYVEGTVPRLPLPDWAATDQALLGVAKLLRSYHEAAQSFPQAQTDRWRSKVPEHFKGDIICHQDVSPSNVVFVNGIPSALIDFEFAGPAHILWDIALAARHWAPLKDPKDLDPSLEGSNSVERFGHFCDAYGVDRSCRKKIIEAAITSLNMGLQVVREQVKREDVFYQMLWIRDYEGINRRSCSWLERNREFLVGEP